MGNPLLAVNGRYAPQETIFDAFSSREPVSTSLENALLICRHVLQHPLQRLQPVGLAWWLVPAQPADARKPHRDAGFMPRRALQPLEGDFQHQALVRPMHDVADRAELFGGVAADETVDLQQFLVGEAEIGFADRHQLLAVLARGPDT